MNSIHVIAGLAAHNGGPSYSVPRLVRTLSAQGCKSVIYTVREGDDSLTEAAVLAFPHALAKTPILSHLRLSPALTNALAEHSNEVDIIHNHGLWLLPNVAAGRIAASVRKPLIVSPRGMLAPEALQFSAWKKQFFWAMLQKRSVSQAAVWHATSAAEAEDIRSFGITAPIAIIPNGIDPASVLSDHDATRSQRTVLFLSRVHPKKGVKNLISAWSQVAEQRPSWQLVIAGPDENGHRAELETQITKDGVHSVRFLDAVYGNAKAKLLGSSDVFVLPTKNENFGLVVAEALAAGVPAIVTKGAPWSGLEREDCGWWIDQGVEPLISALLQSTALAPSVRRDMGERGRVWMARDFGWDAIAERMLEVYAWCLSKGERPNCMVTD